MEWQPEPQNLKNLLNLLFDAIHPNSNQLLVQEKLCLFNRIPEYNSYLAYILVAMTEQDNYLRALAGLTLKNNLLNNFNSTHIYVLNHVKSLSLQSLDHPDSDATIRRTIGSVITAIIVRGQVMNWPEAIKVLLNKLDSTEPLAIEMALDTIQKLCEDNAEDLNEAVDQHTNTRILDSIIPKLIPFNNHPTDRFRFLAISAISHFVRLQSPSLVIHMDSYLQSLFNVSSDHDTGVLQEQCRSFVMLLENFTESLLPYLDRLIEYMIFCNKSADEKVALEACDFWHQFAGLDSIHDCLEPFLPRVIPVILNSLIYTDEDLAMFGDDGINSNSQELQLRFSRHRARYSTIQEEELDIDLEDEEDDLYYDEEDPEDDEFFSEWTLRKFSATCLEALTSAFPSQVTGILLPLLDHALYSDDWRVVESGILALGATAEGGIEYIAPHLPQLIPYLIKTMSNPNVHVRYMSCWTVSRFSGWIVAQSHNPEQGRTQFYEPVLRELLRRILDINRRVQEAACSAFSTLEERATNQELVPYLNMILNHLTWALRHYKHRNLRLLYDTIGTLAESVGSSLNDPNFIAALVPPLLSKWNKLTNTDSGLFPLLVCLTDIAASLGKGFLPYTQIVFARCVMLITTTLKSTVNENSYDDPNEFIVVPLDLLSGIVQGLGDRVEPFVKQSTILPLLAVCTHYKSRHEILSPTYALIGDIAKACFHTMEPYLDTIMPELVHQLSNPTPAFKSARNNAIWAVGEIAIRWSPEKMESYVRHILAALVPLIHNPMSFVELQENAINTIGRLGIRNADKIAPFLPQFSLAWLLGARGMRENDEKDTALQGFCASVQLFPQALNEQSIRTLFDIIGQWRSPSDDLKLLFENMTAGYHSVLTLEQWNLVSAGLLSLQNNMDEPNR